MSDAAVARTLITPEGVDLRLQLATAGQRAGAFLVDMAIIFTMLISSTIALLLADGGEVVQLVWLVGFFILRNFYFVAFELRPRAATPGKRIVGLRVAARDGGRLGPQAIFARNAMRDLELWLPLSFLVSQGTDVEAAIAFAGAVWCGVFVLFPLFNRDRLRVGDLVAGTWVVHAPRRRLSLDLADAATAPLVFTDAQLDAYGVKELQVLEDVLRTRDRPTLRAVAARIRAKIDWPTYEAEADFLAAYYAALRTRLERRLLLGRRKADKFDVG